MRTKTHFLTLTALALILIYLEISRFYIATDNIKRIYPPQEEDFSDISYDFPNESTQVKNLPWEWNSEFRKKKEALGANVLMAAYCTVLKDPLPGEEENVCHAAKLLTGTVVMPGEEFSQNNTVGPYTTYRGYKKGPTYADSKLITTIGGGVCKIASTLYNVCTLSDLRILERHPHGMPVPYVPYGQDATVSYGAKDFRFRNTTDFPILIWARCIDTRLYIGFYGQKPPPKVYWHHQVLKVTKATVIQRKNTKLPAGTTKLLREGMDGASVKSWLTIEGGDNTIRVKNLGIDNYKPMPYIYEVN